MIWLVCIILFFIIIGLFSASTEKNDKVLGELSEKRDQELFLNMSLPDFEHDSPLQCLSYICDIPQRYVGNAMYNLDVHGRIKNKIYMEAFNERLTDGTIDIEKYLKKFHTFERGNFSVNSADIEDYEVFDVLQVAGVHLDYRKSYIINDIREGDSVLLRKEPTNRFDKNAIQVIHKYFPFGYIPSTECHTVSDLLKIDYKAYVTDLVYDAAGFVDVEITLYDRK